ncbi:hypothetical protein EDEG_01197 [Edhazardia aedis USNM 41457]|uniref:Uncharacterized protein n=1 Tax=Edhazardia aedis (strain USNM 41457) TaxID=1003232 RepID=J8ZYA2_EDHAE|nr:hypothetical protein EDEG_01197 [Edhazardia aedis USNM 41457]|eukprot:EJW04613.1 hypothetical protein EDEG_01197 [Edhazardia aedis USNM 41457]
MQTYLQNQEATNPKAQRGGYVSKSLFSNYHTYGRLNLEQDSSWRWFKLTAVNFNILNSISFFFTLVLYCYSSFLHTFCLYCCYCCWVIFGNNINCLNTQVPFQVFKESLHKLHLNLLGDVHRNSLPYTSNISITTIIFISAIITIVCSAKRNIIILS